MKWSWKSQPEVRPGDTRAPDEKTDWPAANSPSNPKRWQREQSATSKVALAARPFPNEAWHSAAYCVTTDSPDKSRPTKYSGMFKWLNRWRNGSEIKDGMTLHTVQRLNVSTGRDFYDVICIAPDIFAQLLVGFCYLHPRATKNVNYCTVKIERDVSQTS